MPLPSDLIAVNFARVVFSFRSIVSKMSPPMLRRLKPIRSVDLRSLVEAAAAEEGCNESSVAIASPTVDVAEFAERERVINEAVQRLKPTLRKDEVAADGDCFFTVSPSKRLARTNTCMLGPMSWRRFRAIDIDMQASMLNWMNGLIA